MSNFSTEDIAVKNCLCVWHNIKRLNQEPMTKTDFDTKLLLSSLLTFSFFTTLFLSRGVFHRRVTARQACIKEVLPKKYGTF